MIHFRDPLYTEEKGTIFDASVFGGGKSRSFLNTCADDNHVIIKQKRLIMRNEAKKNLPFGFGPAGEHFVVEEIADIDDDEEISGDFQQDARDNQFQSDRMFH